MGNGTAAVLEPTYRGYVASTQDALILFEACLTGVLHHVPRRPHDRERSHLVQSGSVFIYEENASGIKRWTDGVTWSPSRILGNFLVYRELDKPFPPGEKKRAMKKANRRPQQTTRPGEPYPRQDSSGPPGYSPTTATPSGGFGDRGPQSEVERALVGSLVDSYGFKDSGLVKKTMSVTVSGVTHHLVSYYSVEDVMRGALSPPSMVESLRYIRPRPELTSKQSFRAPIDDLDGPMEDHSDPSQALYGYRSSIMGGQGYAMPNPAAPGYYQMPSGPYASHPPQPAPIAGYPVGGPMPPGHSGSNPYMPNPAASSQMTPKTEDFGAFRPAPYGPGFETMNQNIGQNAMSTAMAPSVNTPVNQMDNRARPPPTNSPILYRNPSMQQSRNAPPEATSPVDATSSSNPAYSRSSFSVPGAQDGSNQPLEQRNMSQSQPQPPPFDPTGSGSAPRRDSNTVLQPGTYYPGGDRAQPPPQSQPQPPQQQQHQTAPPPSQQQPQQQRQPPPPQFYMGAGAPPGQHSAHYPAGSQQPLGTWNGTTPGQAQI